MHRLVVDKAMSRELAQSTSLTEVCDTDGKVIGIFCPKQIPQDLLDGNDVPVDELIEQGKLRGGRLLADVIADLEQRS
jgi:hypothetical protein